MNEENQITCGQLLKQSREDAGKTVEDVAKNLGLPVEVVAGVENGSREVSLPYMVVVAAYLGVTSLSGRYIGYGIQGNRA